MLFLLAAHAACDETIDLDGALARAETAVAEYRLDDAGPLVEQAEAAVGCAWATPVQAARLWNAAGVLAAHQGDEAEAVIAFTAARRAEPETFNADYGSKMRARWAEVALEATEGALGFTQPVPDSFEVRIDGTPSEQPWSLRAGLHLVQVGAHPEPPHFGRIVEIQPGIPLNLELGLTDAFLAAPAPAPRVAGPTSNEPTEVPVVKFKKRRKPKFLLPLSGVAMVSGTVLMGLAFITQEVGMPLANTIDTLETQRRRQLALGYTGYAVLGVGVAGTVVYVVL